MKINIQNLEQNILDIRGQVEPDFLGEELRHFYPHPIDVQGSLDKFGKGYKIDVRVETQAEYICDRCLTKFHHDFRAQQMQIYQVGNDLVEADTDIIELDASAIEIDIDPILTEIFTLHHPIKMLCKDSCKGICPNCGADLNNETCSCADKNTDPRWADLKKLIKGA